VFLLSTEKAPGEVGMLRVSQRRLRRFLASAAGSATVERLLRAGRLDGTVERLVRSGSLPRPPVRRGIVSFLLVCVHDANRLVRRSKRMWSASAKVIGRLKEKTAE
jgi:hypothetical protein